MKNYFLQNEGSTVGPFTIEQLQNMDLQRLTPVWRKDFYNWVPAGSVAELKHLIISMPPPFTGFGITISSANTSTSSVSNKSIPVKRMENGFMLSDTRQPKAYIKHIRSKAAFVAKFFSFFPWFF